MIAPTKTKPETALRPRSLRPKVTPAPQSLLCRSTITERRESLVRSVGNRHLRNSLTADEHKLLLVVSALPVNSTEGSENAYREDESQKVRRKLRRTLNAKRELLTEKEATFIDRLASATDVPVNDIVACNQVLENDPLFSNSVSIVDTETKLCRRPTLRKNQQPYDLWKYCATLDGQAFSCRGTHVQDQAKSQTTLVTAQPDAEPSKNERKNRFTYFWKRAFGLVQDEIHQEPGLQETDCSAGDDDDGLVCFHVLGTSADDAAAQPHVLSPPIMDALRPHMPFAVQHDNFWLKYSLVRDGASLDTMLRKVRGSARTVIAIETTDGHVFGAFTSSPWRTGPRFYGSGEAFLWRLRKLRSSRCVSVEDQVELERDIDIFGWSGRNRNVQFVPNDMSELKIGGGGTVDEDTGLERETNFGFGLVLESDLSKGYSDKCETFGNPSPSIHGGLSFDIANVEVWTMTPVECIEMAEQLELGRQFIFDHGNHVLE